MWLIGAVMFVTGGTIWSWRARARKARELRGRPSIHLMSQRVDGRKTPYGNYTSILSAKTVQQYLMNGAPPLPWLLGRDDREPMEALSRYFARAIPAPDRDGRVSIRDSLGHGGPQLELFVPVLSSKSPVAVLARTWDAQSQTLEPTLFFFGAINQPLAAMVAKLGFEVREEQADETMRVFRSRRHASRRRAS